MIQVHKMASRIGGRDPYAWCASMARYFGREVIRRRPPWGRGPSQGPHESLGNGWRCARRAHRILSLNADLSNLGHSGNPCGRKRLIRLMLRIDCEGMLSTCKLPPRGLLHVHKLRARCAQQHARAGALASRKPDPKTSIPSDALLAQATPLPLCSTQCRLTVHDGRRAQVHGVRVAGTLCDRRQRRRMPRRWWLLVRSAATSACYQWSSAATTCPTRAVPREPSAADLPR